MSVRILVVDDEPKMRLGLSEVLKRVGEVETAEDGAEAIARIDQGGLDVVITDMRMPGQDGMEVLRHCQRVAPHLLVFMISAYGDIPTAVEAMKLGARDFIQKPFDIEDVRARVRAGLEQRELKSAPTGDVAEGSVDPGIWDEFPEIVGRSPAMARVLHTVKKVARSPLPVLVRGETGTGKELIARALHRLSGREGPFLATTGQIPEGLIESELFGHKRGAFTGADADRAGYFEAAAGGTFFLDELGDIPPTVQVKLLRVIQEKEVVRVGEAKPRKTDARLVAATWRDLEEEVQRKTFREDLLYRLNVVTIALPPLRDRGDDVVLLAERFLARAGADAGRELTLTDAARDRLRAHPWKGNIRELENACRGLAVLAAEDAISLEDVEDQLA